MCVRLNRRWLQGFTALLVLSPGAAWAEAALKDAVPHISVVGRAHMEVVPDIAILSLAAVTERAKAEEAAAENAKAAQALVDEIKAQGIDPHDIRTEQVSLTADYEDQSDGTGRGTKRVLRGYIARNAVAVRVHALDKVGALARQLIDKGANQLNGIDFEYEHEDEAYDKLREAAMRDALHRANGYLPPIGASLGRVLEISPGDGAPEPRMKFAAAPMAAMRSAETSIPVEPGTLRLETQVEVTWELIAK